MAVHVGMYQDKGRSLSLLTSIVNGQLRVKDHAVDATISLNPNNAAFADVGEWVQKGATTLSRPATAINVFEVASLQFNGAAGANILPPKLVWSERGGTDVQALEKLPIIEGGIIEGTFNLWVKASTENIVVGDLLGVCWIQGNSAAIDGTDISALTGFTGDKGVLYKMGNADRSDTATLVSLGVTAGDVLWCVGVATSVVTASGDTLQAEIFSSPIPVTIKA